MSEEPEESAPQSWGTLALCAANVVVGVALFLSGASPLATATSTLIDAGAVDALHVWRGEVWRFVSACFVHVAIWHLGLNVWALWQLGRAYESMVGAGRLVLVALSSGIFGFAVSVVWNPGSPTVGASGAVFGVAGGLLGIAFLARHDTFGRRLRRELVPVVALNLLIGVLIPFVNNAAHVGGLVFGFVLSVALSSDDELLAKNDAVAAQRRRRSPWALFAAIAVFAAVVGYGAKPVWSTGYHVALGLDDLRRGRLDAARAHADAAQRLRADDGGALILAGRVDEETRHIPEGGPLILQGLEQLDSDPQQAFLLAVARTGSLGSDDPVQPFSDEKTTASLCEASVARVAARRAPELKNDCAWLYLKARTPAVQRPVRALELAKAAVADSDGKEPTIVHTLAEAHAQNGDPAEGLMLLQKLAAAGVDDDLGTWGSGVSLQEEQRRMKKRIHDAAQPPAPAQDPPQGPTQTDPAPATNAPPATDPQ